jgi:tetratricopeptide (TPR) repeat protein/ankyrin repeat protein
MKPHNYAISKIFCIHQPFHSQGFEAELVNIDEEAQKFLPRWNTEKESERKKVVIQRWKEQTQAFEPIQIPLAGQVASLSAAKVLLLWHGSNEAKCESICSSGFTYFGKHHFFDSHAEAGPASSTDYGYFGSGIYFTNSASYASLYSSGHLLLSWVSMREPYPVINDVPTPQKGTDMNMLAGKGAYQNYNAHYIPVVSLKPENPRCMKYYPCYQGQQPAWDEFVVFQRPQTLTRFWVELSIDTPSPVIKQIYSFSTFCTACSQGDLQQIKAWIEEKPERLQEKNSQGETLLYAAFKLAAYGEHLPILQLFLKHIDTPLILQLVTLPIPKALDFLLANGINPQTTNPFKQTLLHLAAQAGEEENVKILLQQGAPIDAQDLSKRTPLLLAVMQGHRSTVQFLLQNKARVDIQSVEGETVLHAAAFYGYTPILQDLLKDPLCKKLISIQDQDGKTPLHKAVWGDPKPDVVTLLLSYGANPNALNKYGYTPLHWTAKHGHLKSAELLIQHKADPGALNDNQNLPLDLALRHGQDEIVHLFLGTTQRLKKPEGPPPKDILKYYQDCLLQARKSNLIEEQILYLEKMGDHYLENKNFVSAALILNATLAFFKAHKNNPLFEKHLLSKMERIEGMFLETQGITTPPSKNNSSTSSKIDLRRRELQAIRKDLKTESFTPAVLSHLSAQFSLMLKSLIQEAQTLLGPAPVKWSCLGLGSMARGEMCPYSDLEFAFVIEEETPAALDYFRRLARLLQLQIINLGETKCSVFGPGEESPTSNGFCMDTGGNVPLGGVFELITTPKKLAQLQSSAWIDSNIILSNVMNSICLIEGDPKLAAQYLKQKTEVQKLKESASSSNTSKNNLTNREKLAFRLLAGHLQEFSPNLTKEKEEINAFGIKKELYRPFQEIISSLALLYKLTSTNTFERIDDLVELKVLCTQGAANLKKAIAQALNLRLEAHLFYKDEIEFLFHIEEGTPLDPKKLYLTQERVKVLQEIYKVLIPFCKTAQQFYQAQDKQAFYAQKFYDEGPLVQAQALQNTLQYKEAQAAYQQAVSLNPNDIDALLFLGAIEENLGHANAKEALNRAEKALVLAKRAYGEKHLAVARSYNNIGVALKAQEKYVEALESHRKALAIRIKVLGEGHTDVAISYNNVGKTLDSQGKYVEALESHRKALAIWIKVLGEGHPGVALSYSGVGTALDSQGKYAEGLESHRKALAIYIKVFGEGHPDVATSYQNIGTALSAQEKYAEALGFCRKALAIEIKVLGEGHPNVATSYQNIGTVLYAQGEYVEALESYRKALEIRIKMLGEGHPDVARSYAGIGVALHAQGKYAEALEFYRKASAIWIKVPGEGHPDVATNCNNIGSVLYTQGKYVEALESHRKALEIRIKMLGEGHPDVALSYNNIGTALHAQGKYDEALESHRKALEIRIKMLGEGHPDVASSYNDIGTALKAQGKHDEAAIYYQKATKSTS